MVAAYFRVDRVSWREPGFFFEVLFRGAGFLRVVRRLRRFRLAVRRFREFRVALLRRFLPFWRFFWTLFFTRRVGIRIFVPTSRKLGCSIVPRLMRISVLGLVLKRRAIFERVSPRRTL